MTSPSLRLTHRDPSPEPHPQVEVDPGAEELRRRMAAYVRDQLVTDPELRRIGWSLEVGWDEQHVWATLTRGELVIPATWTRRTWWMPQRKSAAGPIVASLVRILLAHYVMYADADETGRMRIGDLVLEPGVRKEGGGASPYGMERFCRIGEHRALTLDQAREAGWLREAPG